MLGENLETTNNDAEKLAPFAKLGGEKMPIPKMIEVISGVVLAGYVKENEYAGE